jgi:hypothetical protein
MSTWTDPKSWVTGELVTAADLNTYLRDNLLFLRNVTSFNHVEVDATYSTTSTTWVDIDATQLSLTVATHGGVLLLGAEMAVAMSNGLERAHFDVTLNGTRLGGSHGLLAHDVVHNAYIFASDPLVVSFQHFIPALPAGTHTLTLQWFRQGGSPTISLADTASGGIPVQFYAMEFGA